MRFAPLLALAGALVLTAPAQAAAPSKAIEAAIAAPDRPQKDRDRDASRHPAELIAFSGLKAGDRVLDFWTGSGYWSRLFSPVVGPKGRVYAYVPEEIKGFKSDPLKVAKDMAAEPGRTNVEVVSDKLADPPPAAARGTLDVVFLFENYHDLHDKFVGPPDIALVNKAVFDALKPGGVFVIVDHAAPAGSGLKNTDDLHRIDPATVKAELTAAGFRLDGESPLLADATDAHDKNVFDPMIRGKTDRFVFRFRKPKR